MGHDSHTNLLGTTNLQISPRWYDIVDFGRNPHGFTFGFIAKDLIPLKIVAIILYKLMIIPLFNWQYNNFGFICQF